MPTYTFKNKKTGEFWTEVMTYDESLKFLEENPDIEKDITMKFPAMVSGVESQMKCDEGFNDLLREMDKHHRPMGGKITIRD